MKVTKPLMMTALWYLSFTPKDRNQRNMVVAPMDARENDSVLYTAWNCRSVISNMVIADSVCVNSSKYKNV